MLNAALYTLFSFDIDKTQAVPIRSHLNNLLKINQLHNKVVTEEAKL
jgi:hypothetical protein